MNKPVIIIGGAGHGSVIAACINDNRNRFGDCEWELKGFCKNLIKAGDKITVSFNINEKMLEFYRGDLKKVAEKGSFKIYIGADSNTQSYVEITLL